MIRTCDPRQMSMDFNAPIVTAILQSPLVCLDEPTEPVVIRNDFDWLRYAEIGLRPTEDGTWQHRTAVMLIVNGRKDPFTGRHYSMLAARQAAVADILRWCTWIASPGQGNKPHECEMAKWAIDWARSIERIAA